ncbi:MAG TPA: LuxR C-terminal-related transcriptional regulator [Candidatus Dormibacteraeota bacterium]|nr:LuxR C-terminal-related transcriptional regulator [Candidatus Dormibacteraeota bacterium]
MDQLPSVLERASVLATKLRIPRVRLDTLARPRLIERLEEASNRALVLVSAPPGFGKSTVLADWARSTAGPVAWLSLDAGDNDASRFWRYVAAALARFHPGLEEQMVPAVQARSQPAHEVLVGTVVNELAAHPQELALVLDDYHVIRSPAVHDSMAFLLQHLPPGLRLVIASRSDPPLAVTLMRARGQLIELRAQDLRFTPQEAAALLLEAWNLDLPEESVAALAERTEGWISGLQLAALSLRGASDPVQVIAGFTGSHRYVLDYLTEEVLERQPESVRDFLLETSILERLSGPLSDAITGRSDGQSMLESLERANLFLVALDEERRWYRYHRLFADLLRVRLAERDGGRTAELHRKAAAWCEDHGLVDDAVRHSLAVGDAHWAAAIVERHVDETLGRGEGDTLRRWLAALSPEALRSRPGLCLVQAITLFNAGHLAPAEAWLDDADRALAAEGGEAWAAGSRGEGMLATIPATVTSVRASLAIARGEPARARRLVQRAQSLMSETDWAPRLSIRWNLALADWMEGRPADAERELSGLVAEGRASGMPHLALSAGSVLGRVQRAQGRLGAALRTYQEGLAFGAAAWRPKVLAVGEAHIGMAEVLYQRDRLDDAMSHVAEGIELCRRLTSAQSLATGLATLAWIRQAMGDPEAAIEAMEEAYHVLPSLDVVSLHNPVPAERARLLLAQGKVSAAATWVEERGLAETAGPTYAREQEYLALARLLLATGSPDRALGLLERLHDPARSQGRVGSVIEVQALEALASHARGDGDRALSRLVGALNLGRPEGYVRVFADEGRSMAALLGGLVAGGKRKKVSVAGDEVPAQYLGRVLRAVRSPSGRASAVPAKETAPAVVGLVEVLTHRELEVVAMLAGGRSNREIADELFVTVDTVKKHVTHILEKLGAANRTQAVARARELGLIR